MGERLIKRWWDKVEIPISPKEIKNNADRKEYFKVQKEIENIVIRLAEYEELGSIKDLKNRIQLKNIDLSEVTLGQQINKVVEERSELFDALNKFKEDEDTKEHVIEELYDNIQALLGLVQKFGISAEEVMEGYPKFLEKFKK